MKTWIKAEITELELKCTEHGGSLNPYIDEVRNDAPNGPWYAFSGPGDDNEAQ